MLPETFQRLIHYFSTLPGVGPRQAARFAFDLLNRPSGDVKDFGKTVQALKDSLVQCHQCYFLAEKTKGSNCTICASPKRDQNTICVVEKETDIINLEKTKAYQGVYHVLGSVVLKSRGSSHPFRLNELITRIKKLAKKSETSPEQSRRIEIILALNPTTEGDATTHYLQQELGKLKKELPNLKISRLGRGLATGNELEYADEETLRSALKRRE